MHIATARTAQQAVEKTNAIFSELDISQDSLIHQYQWASQGFEAHLTTAQMKKLRKDSRVDYVVRDSYYKAIQTISVKPLSAINSFMIFSGQTIPWGINRVNGPLNGTGKTVWILDTGVDLNHPDLNVDLNRSASFVANESADDQNGHGTHVAGIAAALNNSIDVVGVAAGATVVAVKVCDQNGGCYVGDVKAGVEYAASNFASDDVANLSLRFPTTLSGIPALEGSIVSAANSGLKFTIAAGNDSDNANNYSPARVENSNVWTVSAFDDNDAFASFSNYGNPPIEYSEPGVDILSLWKNGGTHTLSGTSMAAPASGRVAVGPS